MLDLAPFLGKKKEKRKKLQMACDMHPSYQHSD